MNKHAEYLRYYSGHPHDVTRHKEAAAEIERLETAVAAANEGKNCEADANYHIGQQCYLIAKEALNQ